MEEEKGVREEGRVVFDVFILRNRFAICVKWCYWGSRCNENFVLYIEETARLGGARGGRRVVGKGGLRV